MYNEDGLYITHPECKPYPKPNFIPKGDLSFFAPPDKPSLPNYNDRHHYYVPDVNNKKEGKMVLMTQFEYDNRDVVKDAYLVEPIHYDWPSTFINFYFPMRDFDTDRLTDEGFIGIFISKTGVRTDSRTSYLQDKFDINLVDIQGLTHMIGGIYCVNGDLMTKCFGCGNRADDCMCSLYRKNIVVDHEAEIFINSSGLQQCYNLPKIKGMSCKAEYGILFLDKNEKKLQIPGVLCEGSGADERTKSKQIPGVPSIQETAETLQYNEPSLSREFNFTTIGCHTSVPTGWGESGSLSSSMGFRFNTALQCYESEERSSYETNQRGTTSDAEYVGTSQTRAPGSHIHRSEARLQSYAGKGSGHRSLGPGIPQGSGSQIPGQAEGTGYRTFTVNANCYEKQKEEKKSQGTEPYKQRCKNRRSKKTKSQRKEEYARWREQRKAKKAKLLENDKEWQEQQRANIEKRRAYQRKYKARIKNAATIKCFVPNDGHYNSSYTSFNSNGPG